MEEHEFLESLSPAGDRPAPSSYPIPLENLWGVGWGGGSSTAEARGSPALTHAPWGFTPHPGALPQNHFTPHGVGFTSAPPRWGSRCPSPPSAPSRSSERTRRSCRSSAPGSTAWGRGGGGGRGGRSGSAARSRAGQSRPDAIPRDPARPDFQPTLSPRPGSAPAACSCAAHRPESPATASPAPTAAAAPPARPRFRFRPRFFRPPPLPPAALPLPAPPPQGGGKGAAVAARAKDDAQAGTLGCFYLQYFEVNIIARHERRCGLNRYVMARECPLLSLTLRRLPGKTSPRLTYTVSKNTKSPNCSYQNTSRREGE